MKATAATVLPEGSFHATGAVAWFVSAVAPIGAALTAMSGSR